MALFAVIGFERNGKKVRKHMSLLGGSVIFGLYGMNLMV